MFNVSVHISPWAIPTLILGLLVLAYIKLAIQKQSFVPFKFKSKVKQSNETRPATQADPEPKDKPTWVRALAAIFGLVVTLLEVALELLGAIFGIFAAILEVFIGLFGAILELGVGLVAIVLPLVILVVVVVMLARGLNLDSEAGRQQWQEKIKNGAEQLEQVGKDAGRYTETAGKAAVAADQVARLETAIAAAETASTALDAQRKELQDLERTWHELRQLGAAEAALSDHAERYGNSRVKFGKLLDERAKSLSEDKAKLTEADETLALLTKNEDLLDKIPTARSAFENARKARTELEKRLSKLTQDKQDDVLDRANFEDQLRDLQESVRSASTPEARAEIERLLHQKQTKLARALLERLPKP